MLYFYISQEDGTLSLSCTEDGNLPKTSHPKMKSHNAVRWTAVKCFTGVNQSKRYQSAAKALLGFVGCPRHLMPRGCGQPNTPGCVGASQLQTSAITTGRAPTSVSSRHQQLATVSETDSQFCHSTVRDRLYRRGESCADCLGDSVKPTRLKQHQQAVNTVMIIIIACGS